MQKFPQTILQLHIILLITVQEQKKSNIVGDFSDYEHNVDGQIRSVTKSDKISLDKLNYYKSNFVNLVNSENKNKKNNHWFLAISGDYGPINLKN